MQNQNKKSINEKELETLKFWNDNQIFEKSLITHTLPHAGGVRGGGEFEPGVENSGGEAFTFYDGPPFATGMPHHGHVLAGTIKDAIPRYQTMKGKSVRRVWGWDCHGLPIENMIEKELNLNSKKDIETYGVGKFNEAAANSVLRYEEEWKKIIPRLGRWVDMEHPYKTMDATYTESVWWSWKTLYDKGLAYEGHKIMHICPRCETPLAQSEVGLEYHDVTDLSVTVEFELTDHKYNDKPLYVLAWTTTPWTLPGNSALAISKNINYVIVESEFENNINYFIVAKSKVEEMFKNSSAYKILEENVIEKYLGAKYKPPFQAYNNSESLQTIKNSENIWKIWHADFITEETGTGIAHEAPAFGLEDMELAKANNIPVIKHVNMNGTFDNRVIEELARVLEMNTEDLKDIKVKKKDDTMSTDVLILRALKIRNLVFEKHKIVHSYPLCWRCKTPLLNYATSSWFVDVPAIKDKLISENQKIKWVPEHIRDGRFGMWLAGAREWAVSRARYWGAPLPVWKSESGRVKVLGSLEELAELNIEKYKNQYIIMRHGEAKSNAENYYDEGQDNSNHLTEKGKEQVKASALALAKENIDIIIYSPVLRSVETMSILNSILNINDTFEMNEIKESVENNLYDVRHEVQVRMQNVIEGLEQKYNGKKILMITHQGPARGLFKQNGVALLNLELGEYRYLPNGILPRDESGAINLHRPYIDEIELEIEGERYYRIKDVFDCWYESGSMPFAQLHYPFENKKVFDDNYPADFIAEGMDQTRGWFYSLINLGVGLFDKSPYEHVIVNGVVMADDGRKMSKSEKNYTDPMELVERYGADSLRLALANSPVMQGENVLFSDSLVEEVYKKNIMKLENVLDFYRMNSDANIEPKHDSQNVLDRWILAKLKILIGKVSRGYDNYKLDEANRPIEGFIEDLSQWYVRRSRDRYKGLEGEDERIAGLATCNYVLIELAKLMAPMAPFIAERIYRELSIDKESVHLAAWPRVEYLTDEDENILAKMGKTRDIVSQLLMLRSESKIPVRQPLASVTLNVAEGEVYENIVKEELNIKSIIYNRESELQFDLNITEELKREGQQRELSRAIKDMRKDRGLIATDNIILTIDENRVGLLDDDYKKDMKIVEVRVAEALAVDKA